VTIDKDIIKRIVEETLSQMDLNSDPSDTWLHETMDQAIISAKDAFEKYKAMRLQQRKKAIESIRKVSLENAEKWAQMAFEETKYGSKEHKIIKCELAAGNTPGVEDLDTHAVSGDHGLTLTERAPYGVIGSITPSTNPVSTLVNNSISMIAAGNAVVYNPHPAATKTCIAVLKGLNEAIEDAIGIANLLCTVKQPNIKSANDLMNHKDIKLLAITGGEAVVNAAMRTGKKCIAAGPGNPPVIVDETADIDKAAKDIINGASFDNNILCIAEKETFALKSIVDELVNKMQNHGGIIIDEAQAEKVLDVVLTNKDGKYAINRDFVGKDASYILDACGIAYDVKPILIITQTKMGHPFVMTEMLMPIMPIVSVDTFDQALEFAVEAEQGFGHSAMIHSTNITHLSAAATRLNTTIFVKNAPSYAGIGFCGEGYTTLTIATPTGEGLTSAKSFTRSRRCVLSGSFRIV
jgi:acyl-CoA reductase-like NAD-dependent aldehyde dehydrogenase